MILWQGEGHGLPEINFEQTELNVVIPRDAGHVQKWRARFSLIGVRRTNNRRSTRSKSVRLRLFRSLAAATHVYMYECCVYR